MVGLIEQLRVWTEQVIALLGYPGISLMMLLENVFPPIPSEVIMPFSGFLVASGEFSFVGVVAAGTVGSVLGALVLYYVGYWANEPVIRGLVRRWGHWLQVSEADLDRSLSLFDRYGSAVVLIGRVIPLVRSLVSIPAGICKMPLPRFILLTTIGSALWSAALAYAGVLLGENWSDVIGFLERYESVVNVVFGVIIVLVVARFVLNRLRAKPSAAGEAP